MAFAVLFPVAEGDAAAAPLFDRLGFRTASQRTFMARAMRFRSGAGSVPFFDLAALLVSRTFS